MWTRLTLLMQVTTDPTDKGSASAHSGGWSESFWAVNAITAGNPAIVTLANHRRLLLPGQASIVGYRLALYEAVGNRLIPAGSSTGKLLKPGNTANATDVPQMALELSGKSAGSANSSRFVLRCIPDNQVERGEYQPTNSFAANLDKYIKEIIDESWKFLGRDLTKPSLKVLSIAGAVVTLSAPWGGVNNVDWIRFRHVSDDDDKPVKGAYLVTASAGNTVTLAGFPARTLTTPSGTARIDAVTLCNFASITPSRIRVRKVGRPFEGYRGRGSKR